MTAPFKESTKHETETTVAREIVRGQLLYARSRHASGRERRIATLRNAEGSVMQIAKVFSTLKSNDFLRMCEFLASKFAVSQQGKLCGFTCPVGTRPTVASAILTTESTRWERNLGPSGTGKVDFEHGNSASADASRRYLRALGVRVGSRKW
jgi:hypothetical protein